MVEMTFKEVLINVKGRKLLVNYFITIECVVLGRAEGDTHVSQYICQKTAFTVCALGIRLQIRLAQRALLTTEPFHLP